MWRKIEQKIVQIHQASGIEIIILEGDEFVINVTTALTKGNAIAKDKEINGLHQLAELAGKLDPALPVALVINGKAVLTKKINSPINTGMVQSVLPNGNPNEFYYEQFSGKDGEIISIIRKETANKIISELKKLGFKIISVSPGFSAITNILPFLKAERQQQLETDSLLLEVNNANEITNFKNKEQVNNNKYQGSEYLVANQYIKPANMLSFAAATGLLADDLKAASPVNEQALSADRKEYRYYKLFKTAGWTVLIFTLTLLLVNFFIYNHYFSKNKAMAETRQFSTQQDMQFRLLEKEVKRKEKFLEQSGWTGSSRTSFYADRIAALVPGNILLTSMQVYPTRRSLLSESGNNPFKKDTILVAGQADDPVELNQFMSSLKLLPDFKEVSVKNYIVRNENGLFTMEIITR